MKKSCLKKRKEDGLKTANQFNVCVWYRWQKYSSETRENSDLCSQLPHIQSLVKTIRYKLELGGGGVGGSITNWFCRVLNNNEQSPIIKSLRHHGGCKKQEYKSSSSCDRGPAGLAVGWRDSRGERQELFHHFCFPLLHAALIIKFINQRWHEF